MYIIGHETIYHGKYTFEVEFSGVNSIICLTSDLFGEKVTSDLAHNSGIICT